MRFSFLEWTQSIKQDSIVNKETEIEREFIGITGIVYKSIVLYGLETDSLDRLRTPSSKTTGKICLDRIYDGVTYLSCRANNIVYDTSDELTTNDRCTLVFEKYTFFFQKWLCYVKSEHVYIHVLFL